MENHHQLKVWEKVSSNLNRNDSSALITPSQTDTTKIEVIPPSVPIKKDSRQGDTTLATINPTNINNNNEATNTNTNTNNSTNLNGFGGYGGYGMGGYGMGGYGGYGMGGYGGYGGYGMGGYGMMGMNGKDGPDFIDNCFMNMERYLY